MSLSKCRILGIRILDSRNKTLYVPLSRRNHPTPTDIVEYRPENLPLRSHDQFMAQAKAVESVPTEIQQEELAKAYGIKGTPLLSSHGSLRFPQSFLYDFLHQISTNYHPIYSTVHGKPPPPMLNLLPLSRTPMAHIQPQAARVPSMLYW